MPDTSLTTRRRRPDSLRLLPCSGDGALARAALWSASYYRFFGARYGREQMPSGLRPMSCGETSRALEKLEEHRPALVRRCLSQMLASGYIPDEHNSKQFRDLVERAVNRVRPVVSAEDAMDHLKEIGLRDYAAPSAAEGEPTLPADPTAPIPGPTVITFSGDLFTARKQIFIPHPFAQARRLADPLSWKTFGPFWDEDVGGDIRAKWDRRTSDRHVKKGHIYEKFVVNWNSLLLQEFDVCLRATQRTTTDMVRTDYSLVYEVEDQLLVDQGYGEVTRVKDRPEWSCYTGEKTLKFASTMLNLLGPGVMAMFLDGNVAAFYDTELFKPKGRRTAKRR